MFDGGELVGAVAVALLWAGGGVGDGALRVETERSLRPGGDLVGPINDVPFRGV
jgi:hypothetical protein